MDPIAGGADSKGGAPQRMFLSHTSDLGQPGEPESFVGAAVSAVLRARHAVTDMRYFAARDTAPADYCSAMVAQSDVYVGIIGVRYGSLVRDRPDLSYTELEFKTATVRGLPRLIFLIRETSPFLAKPRQSEEHGARQQAFRAQLLDSGLMVYQVASPHELELAVYQALVELGRAPAADPAEAPRPAVTLVHLSDLRFGSGAGGSGAVGTPGLEGLDDVGADLQVMAGEQGLRPDLLVVSGDLTSGARPDEFRQAQEFLETLGEQLDLRRRIVIVPGDQDVSADLCMAYFLWCQGRGIKPQRPYWDKWGNFKEMFDRFYQDVPSPDDFLRFENGRPWTLFKIPDLRVVVAGLNSTMDQSHRSEDRHGFLGRDQRVWFSDRLGWPEHREWTRIGVLHHPLLLPAEAIDQTLRDTPDLERALAPHLDLVCTATPTAPPRTG